ncbi:hypothetical protein LJC09_05375 [Desulfovibrio sp. OttesenSCG-928-F20]|nr:hypothetical protein [Desulfovibrio sp. OttesenSCG-928-M16]MDL2291511.1 hypothetical protein [Desulfovibrio sp. OttesenSCG-928-F20]
MTKPSDLMSQRGERVFSTEELAMKRLFYERMSERRRRFVNRIGFENWDPFEAPKEPMDIRTDPTRRTVQDLVRDFMASVSHEMHGGEYARGATECAVGIVAKQEKYLGVLDFCVWYHQLLQKENPSR